MELLEARAASADARLLSIRQKKHPLETDYNPVKTKAMKLVFPPPALCTDNGVMVAWAGIEKLQLGISDSIEGQVMMSFYNLMFLLVVVLFLFILPPFLSLTLPPFLSLTLPPTLPSFYSQEVVARWPLGAPIDNGNATFRKGGLKYPTLVEKAAPITP